MALACHAISGARSRWENPGNMLDVLGSILTPHCFNFLWNVSVFAENRKGSNLDTERPSYIARSHDHQPYTESPLYAAAAFEEICEEVPLAASSLTNRRCLCIGERFCLQLVWRQRPTGRDHKLAFLPRAKLGLGYPGAWLSLSRRRGRNHLPRFGRSAMACERP